MLSKVRMHENTFAKMTLVVKVLATLIVAILALSYSGSLFAADTFKGQKIYTTNCAVCHGQNGQARLPGAPSFNRGESILKPDFTLLAAIRAGKNAMPAFQGILSDRDIMDVIAYVRTLN